MAYSSTLVVSAAAEGSAKLASHRVGDRSTCSHCGRIGHVAATCFEIIGYPEWFDSSGGRACNFGGGRCRGARGKSGARANAAFSSVILLRIIIIIVPFPAASAADRCNHTCDGRTVPFPFGFSAACPIRLDCAPGGAVLAAGLPVQSINGDTLSLGLRAACRRPVEALRSLFTENFAPTATNAILLRECRNRTTGADCFMPRTAVQTHFELADCDGPAVSCYADPPNRTAFMDYRRMASSGCRWLFSAISMGALANDSAVSLDVEVVRVGWWLRGGCRCSEHARCVHVSPPEEGSGAAYRCECLEGFTGDGFRDGLGCRQGKALASHGIF
ncbi:Wall-associated receptor kinase-like 14 [Striga hermonthica]|uniref:Wall-associated receptor kinase-like 14 n=1 Tax=Striga hermonthica TaxID=68872 RepID=A0A9N7NKI0_STRHE|nr:Wall-associated receptor kinase-like 14 [Striga hermonthica]